MAIYGNMIQEPIDGRKIDWILMNLPYVPFTSEERNAIEKDLDHITVQRLDEIYDMINANLPEPIENGMSYNQGDIQRRLDTIMKDERK